jgi:hypothetical protein
LTCGLRWPASRHRRSPWTAPPRAPGTAPPAGRPGRERGRDARGRCWWGAPANPRACKEGGGMDGRACFDCTESEGGRGALGKGRRGTRRSGRESPAGVLAWRVSRLDPVFAQLVACTPPDSRGQGICRSVTCATASVLKRDTSSGQFSNLNDLQYYF